MRKIISFNHDKKLILMCPKGLSFEQMRFLSENTNSYTQHYEDNKLIREGNVISDTYDESLNHIFPEYEKLVFVKNPYWRILQIYLWNFLYTPKYDSIETFKKTLKSIYYYKNPIIDKPRIFSEMGPQNILQYYNFFKVENFSEEMSKWFGVTVNEDIEYFSKLKKVSSHYHESMECISDFFDRESASIIYEIHQPIFEKFGYSFYSYLDYHDEVNKIHHLHGNIVNKFEM